MPVSPPQKRQKTEHVVDETTLETEVVETNLEVKPGVEPVEMVGDESAPILEMAGAEEAEKSQTGKLIEEALNEFKGVEQSDVKVLMGTLMDLDPATVDQSKTASQFPWVLSQVRSMGRGVVAAYKANQAALGQEDRGSVLRKRKSRSETKDLAKVLAEAKDELRKVLIELQNNWLAGSGGFSATGRASDLTAADGEESVEADSAWIHGGFAEMANQAPDDSKVTSSKEAQERASGATSLFVKEVDNAALAEKPAVQHKQDFTGSPHTQDRGKGQSAVMGGNARALAISELGEETANKADWEWLHLQAASLSGITAPSNLVLGTRDANTWMMPFEKHVHALASNNIAVKLDVEPKKEKGDSGHVFEEIAFSWNVADEDHVMTVMPLDVARPPLSKEEVENVQSFLKLKRDALIGKDDSMVEETP